jgi:hypothetical protein
LIKPLLIRNEREPTSLWQTLRWELLHPPRPQVVAAPSLIAGFEEGAALTLIGAARSAIVEPVMPDSLRRP